jgi:hypothetical protein
MYIRSNRIYDFTCATPAFVSFVKVHQVVMADSLNSILSELTGCGDALKNPPRESGN